MATPWTVHQAYHRRQRENTKEQAVLMDLIRSASLSDPLAGVFYEALTYLRGEAQHLARQLHPAGKQR